MHQLVLTRNTGCPTSRLVCHSKQNCRVRWNKVLWTIHVMVGEELKSGLWVVVSKQKVSLGKTNMFIFENVWRCLPLGPFWQINICACSYLGVYTGECRSGHRQVEGPLWIDSVLIDYYTAHLLFKSRRSNFRVFRSL